MLFQNTLQTLTSACLLRPGTSGGTRVSFHTGTGNIVPRLVTDLTDFFGENKEFSMILGKNWNFKVVFD